MIDQIAVYRDHGMRYPVLANVGTMQTKLRRGLSSVLPFMKILRGIRRL